MDAATPYVMGLGLGTTLGLLGLLGIGHRLVTPHRTLAKDLGGENAARRLLQVGQVLAVFLVAAHAVKSCAAGESVIHDLLWVAAFAVTGLALVVLTGQLGIRLLLRGRLTAEIERGNTAAGLAAGASYVATGIVTGSALGGSGLRDLGLTLGFFALAQLTLQGFIALFRALTIYDDAEQIRGENLAAALSYAGLSVAVAVVVGRALEGDFVSLAVSLREYGEALLFLFALYPLRQVLVETLLLGAPLVLRGGQLDLGIAKRNLGMAALEAVTYLAAALAIAHLL